MSIQSPFFPKQMPFPTINLDVFLRQAATDIISLLTNPVSTTTLSLQAGDETKNALLQLATILQHADNLPTTASAPASISSAPTLMPPDHTDSPRVRSPLPMPDPMVFPTALEDTSPRIKNPGDLQPRPKCVRLENPGDLQPRPKCARPVTCEGVLCRM